MIVCAMTTTVAPWQWLQTSLSLWQWRPEIWSRWGSILEAVIGRVDLLELLPGNTEKQQNLDLSPLIEDRQEISDKPQSCLQSKNEPFDKGLLAERMVSDMLGAIESKSGGTFNYQVGNCDRSIGARLSGEIATRYGNKGMEGKPLTLNLEGAGQSLGV